MITLLVITLRGCNSILLQYPNYKIISDHIKKDTTQFDYNNQMITLLVITLSDHIKKDKTQFDNNNKIITLLVITLRRNNSIR